MKLAYLTASTAVLLLSSTALMAQSESAQTLDNVYIDVGGTAVQVPAAQAAEACAMDEATIQQVAQTRLSESGFDPAVVYGLGNENAEATATSDTAAATTTDDAAGAEALGEMGGDDAAATADAGATAGAETASGDMASADASATTDPAAGTDTAAADASGTMEPTADATAAADASGTAEAGGVENVEATAADASAGADPMLQLAVCQVDQARATEIGIDMSSAGAMGSTGTTAME